MKKLVYALTGCVFLATASAAATISASERAELQATMATHIQRHLVNQRFIAFDPASGLVRALQPLEPHPVMFSAGSHFILCNDFQDPDGRTVNVDFFATRGPKGFVIFETVLDQPELVRGMVARGTAQKIQ